MQGPQYGVPGRRCVRPPDIPFFRHPINFNNVCPFPNGNDPHVRSLRQNRSANGNGFARFIERNNQTVRIGALRSEDDRVLLTHISNDLDVGFFPNRVIEHVAPDSGRVRNQDANLFVFQRIALRAGIFAKAVRDTQGPSGFIFGPVLFGAMLRTQVLNFVNDVLVLGTGHKIRSRRIPETPRGAKLPNDRC
jgi:hypothetical protein